MEVVNETRGQTLSADAELRDTMKGRSKGLMGADKMDVILAFRFQSRFLPVIHMFGMKYPIDVVWVGKDMVVVDVKKGVEPSRIGSMSTWFHAPRAAARYVVELGAGSAGDTRVGDVLRFG